MSVYVCTYLSEMGVLISSILYLGLFWNINDDPNALTTTPTPVGCLILFRFFFEVYKNAYKNASMLAVHALKLHFNTNAKLTKQMSC